MTETGSLRPFDSRTSLRALKGLKLTRDKASLNGPIRARIIEPRDSQFLQDKFSQAQNALRSLKKMSWVCGYCSRSVPCVTEGTSRKKSIHIHPTWTKIRLTVLDTGEQCYPCPTCETTDGRRAITHWDHPDIRLHKRLRQHHARAHHQLLREKYNATEVVEFYDDARRLRCELVHGPNDRDAVVRDTPATTPPRLPEPAASPDTPSRRRARNFSAKQSHAIILPPSYLEWLENELRPDSVASYAGVAKTFLHWYGTNCEKPGVLADVWDVDRVRLFIAELKPQVAPTTVFNYLCALQTAQRFVRQRGEIEPSPAVIYSFAAMFRQASRGKTDHQKVVAEKKRKTSVTLHEVRKRILDNKELYKRFKGFVKLCADGGSLAQTQFTWATGFALFNLQASNFKRNGNTLKIEFKPALKRIKAALKHRKACELVITNATKTGGTEVFSIVKMQRIKILLMYATFLRPSAMGTGQCPQFFVNSLGKRITKAAPYISALGKSVGLPNLTIKDLRSRIETEAAVRGKDVDRAAIADHLAHTEATRDKHYLLLDKRRSREAAMDVERLIDEAEPPEDSDADTSIDSSVLSEDNVEYDDDSSSAAEDEKSPEDTDVSMDSSPSGSLPESNQTDVFSEEETSSNVSKTEEIDDLLLSPTPSPSPSKKRERERTGLSSESESGDASPTPTPLTKKARLSERNPELTPKSSQEFHTPLHGTPPQRTNEEFDRAATPSPSHSKEREGPPNAPSSSSRGSIKLKDVTIPDGERMFSPEASPSPRSTKDSRPPALHQRPRTSSENAAIEPKTDSSDEGSKSDPGESSPPLTRTLRHRIYTIPKKK